MGKLFIAVIAVGVAVLIRLAVCRDEENSEHNWQCVARCSNAPTWIELSASFLSSFAAAEFRGIILAAVPSPTHHR